MRILQSTDLSLAAKAVEAGELVVVPTARWYMLCCDASNDDACARVYRAKRRPLSKSLLLVLPSKEDARSRFKVGSDAERLIDTLWPGDLALLLRWANAEDGLTYSAVGEEVALVSHPSGVLGALAQQTSVLLAATSANISGTPASDGDGPSISINQVAEFARRTGTELAAIVDGGICPQFTHMTIVDCSDPDTPSRIVRDGAVHRHAVAVALAELTR